MIISYNDINNKVYIIKKKKYKKPNWLSEEALQIAVKRREPKAKDKGKDRPT